MPRRETASNKPPPDKTPPTTKSGAEEPVKRTCFLDLPAEIRNEIYELALQENPIVTFPTPSETNKKGRATQYPRFLMASKQIYGEALQLFYSSTAFHFKAPDNVTTWLRKLGTKKRSYLRNIVIKDELELELRYHCIPGNNYGAVREYRVCEHLRVFERRLRDHGLGLKTGSITMRVRCWLERDHKEAWVLACRQDGEVTRLVQELETEMYLEDGRRWRLTGRRVE